jgi:hypothetical protein
VRNGAHGGAPSTFALLNHADEDQILGGVDPEPCTGRSTPIVGSRGPGRELPRSSCELNRTGQELQCLDQLRA